MNKKDYKNILLEKYYTLSEEDFRQRRYNQEKEELRLQNSPDIAMQSRAPWAGAPGQDPRKNPPKGPHPSMMDPSPTRKPPTEPIEPTVEKSGAFEPFDERDRDDIEKQAAAVQAAGISASQGPRRSMKSWKQLEAESEAHRQQQGKTFDNETMTYGELDAQYRNARLSETGDKPLSSRFEDSKWGKPHRGLKIKPGSDEYVMRIADLRSWEAQRRDELKRGQEQFLKDNPKFAEERKRLKQEQKDKEYSAWKQRNAERINTFQAQISTAERPATLEIQGLQKQWKDAPPRDARSPSATEPARSADPDFVGPPRGWVEPDATTDQWGNRQPGWISAIGQGGPTTDVYGVERPDLSVRDQFNPYDPNKNPTGNVWPSTSPAPAPAPAAPAVAPSTPAATPKAPPAATARDGARPAPSVAAFQAWKATQPEEDPDAIPPLPPWDSSFRAPLSTATPSDERKRPFPLASPLSRRSSRTNQKLSTNPFIAGRIKPKSPNTTLMASYDYFHQALKNKYSFIREDHYDGYSFAQKAIDDYQKAAQKAIDDYISDYISPNPVGKNAIRQWNERKAMEDARRAEEEAAYAAAQKVIDPNTFVVPQTPPLPAGPNMNPTRTANRKALDADSEKYKENIRSARNKAEAKQAQIQAQRNADNPETYSWWNPLDWWEALVGGTPETPPPAPAPAPNVTPPATPSAPAQAPNVTPPATPSAAQVSGSRSALKTNLGFPWRVLRTRTGVTARRSPNTKPETLMASYDYFHQALKNKYSFIREEIVNVRNKGSMSNEEISSRDRLAKRVKARAIKGKDTELNARYRLATYITLKNRTEGSTRAKKQKKSR